MLLPVGSLSSYIYCARKLYLQQVLGLAEAPKESLLRGSIRHKAYENINKIDEQIVKRIKKIPDIAYLLQLYKQEHSKVLRTIIIENKKELRQFNLSIVDVFKQTWPLVLPDSEARAYNLLNFIKKHDVFGDELWNMLVPKISSELRIESLKLSLKGIIDEVHIYPDSYVPFELKTGKAPDQGVWPGHKIQLGAYALLLEDKFDVEIKEGFVRYLDSDTIRPITINPFLRDEVISLIGKVKTLLSSGNLPEFCSNENKCSSCGLKSICHDSVALKRKADEMLH